MASIERTVEIIFGATDNTGTGLSSITNNINNLGNSAGAIAAPLAKVAESAVASEAAILALGATFITVAVNQASKFGEKIEEIGSLVNATPEQFNQLSDSVLDFAKNVNGIGSSSGLDQINEALYNATSNVGSTAKALEIMAVAEKGAQVGATDLNTSALLLTGTMNAYGLVTDDSATNTANAERVMSVMFATVQNGKTTMTELSAAMGRVASTAAAAGVPIETVGAAIAALTGAGISTDESMTLLNALLRELLAPSDNLTAALHGLSVTTDGLPKVLEALEKATGGSAEKFFGLFTNSEAAKSAMILANDSAGKFGGTLTAMSGSVEAFNTNYANMAGGVKDSNQKLINEAAALQIRIGAPLQDSWAGILDSLTKITDGFSVSIDAGAFEPAFNAFKGFEDDIAAVFNNIAKNLPEALGQVDFSGLIASFKEIGFEVGGIFDGVDLTTPRGLADVIQFITDAWKNFNYVVSGVIDQWGPVFKWFAGPIESFGNLESSSAKAFGQLAGASSVFMALKGALESGGGALDTFNKGMTELEKDPAINGIITTIEMVVAAFAAAAAYAVTTAVISINKIVTANPLVAALAFAVGSVTFAVKENVTAWDEYKDRQTLVAGSTKVNADNQSALKDKMAQINAQLGVNFGSVSDLNSAMDKHLVVMDKTTGAYSVTADGAKEYGITVDAATKSNSWFADAVNAVAKNVVGVGQAVNEVAIPFATLAEAEANALDKMNEGRNVTITFADGIYTLHSAQKEAVKSSDDLSTATKNASKAAEIGSENWKRVQEVMLDTQKQTDEFSIKLGELANKRYDINVKAFVDLKTADIEAQTARIDAAFKTTAEIVGSLSPAITDLWALFSNKAGFVGGKELEEAAKRMEGRLDKELEQKQQLTDAIVAKMNAQTERMLSGDAMIRIDSGDLAPELDSLFEKVLQRVQIKATEEGFNLLLGLGAD